MAMRAMQTHRAGGTSLIEALVALLVLAFGLLALVRLQIGLQADTEVARQRAHAMRLAQSTFEALRLAPNPAAATGLVAVDDEATLFQVVRHLDPEPMPGATAMRLAATWTDRRGAADGVELHGILAAADPVHTAALALPRGAAWPLSAPSAPGASPRLPPGTIDLRDGRSVLPPAEGSDVALLFDNRTGRVIGRCAGLSGTDLDLARLGTCRAIAGYWLGGVVRLDPALPPDPAWIADRPAPFAVRLVLTAGRYPHAADCRVGVVARPGNDRYATWHCTVYPRRDGRWSGRVSLVPQGWTIGTVVGTRQVCRYVNPPDPTGRLDPNLAHPANYVDVAGNLPNQNYLLIRGEDSCPVSGNNGDDPATTEPDPP